MFKLFHWTALSLALSTSLTFSTEPLSIDWDAARAQKVEDEKRTEYVTFRSAATDAKSVELPVLVLGEGPTRSNDEFAHQTTSYAVFYQLSDGDTLSVLGTGVVETSVPDIVADNGVVEDFQQSEDGADLFFERFGALYVLRVNCKDPSAERCTDPTFLSSVRDALVVAGGVGI